MVFRGKELIVHSVQRVPQKASIKPYVRAIFVDPEDWTSMTLTFPEGDPDYPEAMQLKDHSLVTVTVTIVPSESSGEIPASITDVKATNGALRADVQRKLDLD